MQVGGKNSGVVRRRNQNYKMVYNGTTNNVTIPYSANLNLGNGNFSTGGKIKPNTTTGNRAVWRSTINGGNLSGFLFVCEGTNFRVYMSSDGVGWNLAVKVLKIFSVNELFSFFLIRIGTSFEFYINNTLVHSFISSASLVNNASSNYAMGQYSGYSAFSGDMFDMFLYDRALTSSERADIHSSLVFDDALLLISFPPIKLTETTLTNEGSESNGIVAGDVTNFIQTR